ncbi:MAG: GAF domain-containing sensor histidine kinase [Candidatus Levyibacteriota bacterium]|jgi:signal transduction histidine kinase
MSLTLFNYTGVTITVVMAVVLVVLIFKQKKQNREIQARESLERQRLYQISILKQIQDKIGYSLDIEEIVDVITGSLKHLFPYSTVASILIKESKLVLKINVEETVSTNFLAEVKKTMLASLSTLIGNLPGEIEQKVQGIPLDETKNAPVASFFNIPLVIGNDFVGLINVSSKEKHFYKEDEVTILYQIVDQASNALLKLKNVLEIEKGKLLSMISSLVDGVFMVDANQNLLVINDAAKTFLGLKTANPVFTDLLVSLGTQYNLLDKISDALTRNTLVEDKEVTINDKIFQIFITPVISANQNELNKPLGASILLHDITVEKSVAAIKEDFTNMMVHELRAPLTAIKDSAELMVELLDEAGKLEKDEEKRFLNIIDQQSKNLLGQIGQVLDAAKIETGKFSINKTTSDIGKVVTDAVEPFLPEARKKQIYLLTQINSPLPKIDIDPLRITQALNNLISNSLKFTPVNGKIVVSVKNTDEGLKVAVTDNGIGIPEDEQADLFSKYYQIRTTPHQLAKKGTGLGLYITKGIVEAHGGMVGVESEGLNKGTTIYFTLPVAEGTPTIIHSHFPQMNSTPLSQTVN